ncbi:MAG TPA: amidohydrolase family protein, partial [Amaricoccus sp.]|nr:amidohydrolase family protein [Amaricoccus sp.]
MRDLVITNALVVTADAAGTVVADGAVAVAGGRIEAIGPAAAIGGDAREVIDARGMLLMPGLVNMHCHAGDSLFRGLVEDLPLEPWLRTVWKAEGAILDRETVRLGATLGLAELLLGGVTTTLDMFWYPDETVGAARDLGMRVATGGIFFDGRGMDRVAGEARLAEAAAFFDAFAGADEVFAGCLPHGAYTVGPESLKAAKAAAEARGGFFSTHAAETRAERLDIETR